MQVGETVLLTVACGLEGIVLSVVEPAVHPMRLTYARFRRAPMHRGASGKIMAAYLDQRARAKLLAAAAEPGLEATLDRVRLDGFVVTHGELDQGASAAAAPILDRRGAPRRRALGCRADRPNLTASTDGSRRRPSGGAKDRAGLPAPTPAPAPRQR